MDWATYFRWHGHRHPWFQNQLLADMHSCGNPPSSWGLPSSYCPGCPGCICEIHPYSPVVSPSFCLSRNQTRHLPQWPTHHAQKQFLSGNAWPTEWPLELPHAGTLTETCDIEEAWDILNNVTCIMRLTWGKLLKQLDWQDWQELEFLQLDQYFTQGMFGNPCTVTSEESVFNLVWTYNVKALNGCKKARCTCDSSPYSGMVHILDENLRKLCLTDKYQKCKTGWHLWGIKYCPAMSR